MFEFKSDLLTLEPCNIVGWDILVSIDVWAHVAIFTHFKLYMDPVWSLLIVGTGCVPWVELPV